MGMPFIDLKTQYQALKTDIDQRIQAVLDHGQYVMGPELKECEQQLAEWAKSKYCLTCASGTDGLLMALMALGIQPGDEVITTAFSFIATAEVIVLAGAKPVFVDIDPVTYNIDPEQIKSAITKKTKAIIPVGLYGQPADMEEIETIAQQHGLYVIEDAAQSFGARYQDKVSGNLGFIGATSFFPAKPLGCYGDGGAVFTDDKEAYERMEQIRNHGSERRYYHTSVGINGRMDTIQCAIILSKLTRYAWEIEQRQRVADRYTSELSELGSEVCKLPQVKSDRNSVWAQYTIEVQQRDQFQQRMNELGVPTAVHYPTTMADQPAYKDISVTRDIPESRKAADHVISLPMFPDMTPEIQEQVINGVRKSLA